MAQYSAGTALAIGLVGFVWLRRSLRRELKPLGDISSAVRVFDPLQQDSALPPVTRAELVPMHQAITNLGAGLAQHIGNERLFSAHAAHAMRTPRAGLDTQLAVSLRECTPELYPRLTRARAAATRLRRVVSALLAHFRSGIVPCLQTVSVDELIAHLTFDGLSIGATGATEIFGDPDLIAAALMNLLENAVKNHASHVTIDVARTAEHTVITVRDNGGGMHAERLAELQAAIDSQRYDDCTGLGLMLADIVARAHQGRLTLHPDPYGFSVALQIANAPDGATMPPGSHSQSGGSSHGLRPL